MNTLFSFSNFIKFSSPFLRLTVIRSFVTLHAVCGSKVLSVLHSHRFMRNSIQSVNLLIIVQPFHFRKIGIFILYLLLNDLGQAVE